MVKRKTFRAEPGVLRAWQATLTRSVYVTAFVSLAAVATLVAVPVAHAQSGQSGQSTPPLPSNVPAALAVPPNLTLAVKALGVGVQIYTCGPVKGAPSQYGWVFRAPEASLFSEDRHRIGSHYAGPTWDSHDGSKIVGEVAAKVDSPSTTAIPWLLLRTKPIVAQGLFGSVTYVQRLHTAGGIAPSMPCNEALAGKIVRVPYSADYYFYRPTPAASAPARKGS